MNNIKGFVTIDAYVNNAPGQSGMLGDLSTLSRTYSLEKGEYPHNDVVGYQLTTFKATNSSNGNPIVVSEPQVIQILSLTRSCVQYATSHMRPYNPIDFKNEIEMAYFNQISNLEFGAFVDNGTIALPEWVSWISVTNNNNVVKVWLADAAFQSQYDEYEVTVVPPMTPLDKFFWSFGQAVTELNKTDSTEFNDLIQDAKDGHPETVTRYLQFDFINRLNLEQKYATKWAVIVYGKQGDNIDTLKDEIIAYILDNSDHDETEWATILPSLFKRTEFSLFPRWDKIASENLGTLSSIYKSMQDPAECLAFVKAAIDYYPDDFIQNNTTMIPYAYKALAVAAVNGNSNVEGSEKIDVVFPDYIPVSSTSPDFGRMSPNTQNWVLFMQELLIVAEKATQYSTVPATMRKQKRGNLLFVSGMYNNANYLVAARSNVSIYPEG